MSLGGKLTAEHSGGFADVAVVLTPGGALALQQRILVPETLHIVQFDFCNESQCTFIIQCEDMH